MQYEFTELNKYQFIMKKFSKIQAILKHGLLAIVSLNIGLLFIALSCAQPISNFEIEDTSSQLSADNEITIVATSTDSTVATSTDSTVATSTDSTVATSTDSTVATSTDSTSIELVEVRTGTPNILVYHSNDETNTNAVELGQAIVDDASKPHALDDSDVILEHRNLLVNSEYIIHIAESTENTVTSKTIRKLTNGSGSLHLLKSDLANLLSNNVARISISSSINEKIRHIATYRPSNIYDHHDLQAIRFRLNGNYILKKDIEFTEPADDAMSNFEALGDTDSPFTGTLDGAGYSITGLQIHTTKNYQGLFGVLEAEFPDTKIIHDLELIDFTIEGNAYVGSAAAWLRRGTIDAVSTKLRSINAGKVVVRGSIIVEDERFYGIGGGLIGRAGTTETSETQVRIQNSYSEIAVQGLGQNSSRIGGLVGSGDSNMLLTDSYASGPVTGIANENGGLLGYNKGIVIGYASGIVQGFNYVGGLVGVNHGNVDGYATGLVNGTGYNIGGLVGFNGSSSIARGYATGSVSGDTNVGGLVGHVFIGWVSGYASGDVTGTGSQIGGLVGNNNIKASVTGHATGTVKGGSRVGGLVGINESRASGYALGEVTGTSDVGGLVGLNVHGPVSGYAMGSVTGTSSVGGLVGSGTNSIRGYATGNVTGTAQDIGGLIGLNDGGDIIGYATGTVTGSSNVGGLVGRNNIFNTYRSNATVKGFSTGLVKGDWNVGGLVGNNSGVVAGYSRGIVRRANGETATSFGISIGKNYDVVYNFSFANTFHSAIESKLYDGDTGTTMLLGRRSGDDGTAVSISTTTSKEVFSGFSFGADLGEWTWVSDGTWPAINIGDDIQSANEQAIDP